MADKVASYPALARPPSTGGVSVVLGFLSSLHRTLFLAMSRLASSLNALIDEHTTRPHPLPSFNVADLPDATAHEGETVYVPDEGGGAVPAFSNGTDWLRVTDRAIVS